MARLEKKKRGGAQLCVGSTLSQCANDGNGNEECDKLRGPPEPRDAIDAVQLDLLPIRTRGAIVQCVRISPATVRIARRRRVLRTGVMGVRVWVRARGRSAPALPGIVRAPAPRLVRARVMRVRRGGLVMVVVMVARLVLWGAAAGRGEGTVVRSSTAAYALSRQNFEDIGQARGRGRGVTYRCLSFPRTAYASLNARNFSLASGSLFMSGWNCLLNYTI